MLFPSEMTEFDYIWTTPVRNPIAVRAIAEARRTEERKRRQVEKAGLTMHEAIEQALRAGRRRQPDAGRDAAANFPRRTNHTEKRRGWREMAISAEYKQCSGLPVTGRTAAAAEHLCNRTGRRRLASRRNKSCVALQRVNYGFNSLKTTAHIACELPIRDGIMTPQRCLRIMPQYRQIPASVPDRQRIETMDIVADVTDFGAKEINVTGVAAVEAISTDQVRVTYYVARKGEKAVAVHLIWGLQAWLACWSTWDQVRIPISTECSEFARVAWALAQHTMN